MLARRRHRPFANFGDLVHARVTPKSRQIKSRRIELLPILDAGMPSRVALDPVAICAAPTVSTEQAENRTDDAAISGRCE
jgi:hypothetical protein